MELEWGNVIGLAIAASAIVLVVFVITNFYKSESSFSSTILPESSCPSTAKISDYVARMRTFAGEGSEVKDYQYAINVFWEYQECKNPKQGPVRFSTDEIEKNDKEITSCAKAAYIKRLEELEQKKKDSKDPEDITYYDGEIKDLQLEHAGFDALFPKKEYAGTLCNYAATGRSA
jgi:hypothetical protein